MRRAAVSCRFSHLVDGQSGCVRGLDPRHTKDLPNVPDRSCLCRFSRGPALPCAPVLTADAAGLAGRTVAILSSRTGRILRQDHPWLDRLRAALRWVEQSGATLLTALGTTVHPWIMAAHPLLHCVVHPIRIRMLSKAPSTTAVHRACRELSQRGYGSVVLVPPGTGFPCSPGDWILACLADSIVVLSIRQGGNTSSIVANSSVSARIVYASPRQSPPLRSGKRVLPEGSTCPPVLPVRDACWADFLFHWTRAQANGWPDDSPNAHLVRLLLGMEGVAARDALKRIATEGVLRAGGKTGHESVSLTAVPPTEWPRLRRYRSHRGRYDFELYGVAVHRSEALRQGAVPVVYCTASYYGFLSSSQRRFFQPAVCPTNPNLEWWHEIEWRVPGSLVLSCMPPGTLVYLARTCHEAQDISRLAGRPCAYFE